jgi:hypothetical protein
MSPRGEVFVRVMRLALATGAALAALGIGGCGPGHSEAENITGSVLTGDKGEIKGVLTEVGGRPGASPQPVEGKVDASTLGGNDMGEVSPGPAWDYELKPGTYTVQATTVDGVACPPIRAKVVKGVIQVVPLVCPIK